MSYYPKKNSNTQSNRIYNNKSSYQSNKIDNKSSYQSNKIDNKSSYQSNKIDNKSSYQSNERNNTNNHLHYMTVDIKSYWGHTSIRESYENKSGVQCKNKIVKFIKEQSDETTYKSYQIGKGKDINIHYIYNSNQEAAFAQMIYGFIKLANPDLDPILDEMENNNNNTKENWSKSLQGTEGSYNNYSFLNKLVWLPENVPIKVIKEMFVKLTSHNINPFSINSDNEDCYGSLLANFRLSNSIMQQRLDAILISLPSKVVESKIRGILNRATNNLDKFMSSLRYCYCIYPEVFNNIVIEFLVNSIDLPRAITLFTCLSKLMNTVFHTIDTDFLEDYSEEEVYFSDVVKSYSSKISYVTNLKKQSCIAKNNNNWEDNKNSVYELADKIKAIKIKWEPIIADYYFSQFGKNKYPTMEKSIKNLAVAIYNKIYNICNEFEETTELVLINKLSWALESLVGALAEIYNINYLNQDIKKYLLKILRGSDHFKHIPLTIRIKVAIRACIHGCIKDKIILNLIEKKSSLIKDMSIVFLIQDFKNLGKERKETVEMKQEQTEEIKPFYGLDQKSATKKGFEIWIDDLTYDISTRLLSNKISKEDIADRFINDFLCSINCNKKQEEEHLVSTFTNNILLKILNSKVLKISLSKLSKDKEQITDLQIDHPWIKSSLKASVNTLATN